jgi:DNA-binding response OmpR family regulator
MMPGMDGYEFTKELRMPTARSLFSWPTAKQLPAVKKTGISRRTDDYMTKPVDTEEMLWRIKALLRRFPDRQRA